MQTRAHQSAPLTWRGPEPIDAKTLRLIHADYETSKATRDGSVFVGVFWAVVIETAALLVLVAAWWLLR